MAADRAIRVRYRVSARWIFAAAGSRWARPSPFWPFTLGEFLAPWSTDTHRGATGIGGALAQNIGRHGGDPQGRYREKSKCGKASPSGTATGSVTLISPDGGAAVIAHRIEAEPGRSLDPGRSAISLAAGIEIVDASPSILNVKVMGPQWNIGPRRSRFHHFQPDHEQSGSGIEIAGAAHPRIESNLIAANGNANQASPDREWKRTRAHTRSLKTTASSTMRQSRSGFMAGLIHRPILMKTSSAAFPQRSHPSDHGLETGRWRGR